MSDGCGPDSPGRETCALTLAPKVCANRAVDPCTDLANAYRLVSLLNDKARHVADIGWHVWGPPWRLDQMEVRRLAQTLGHLVTQEARDLMETSSTSYETERQRRLEAERLLKWASTSESATRLRAALLEAQPHLSVPAINLDSDADLLGAKNGVVDLRTGKLRPHAHDDYITKVVGCPFDSSAEAPRFLAFIETITGGDSDLADYLQRLVGYSLVGRRGEHVLPIFVGSGANGKSTLLGIWQDLLGDYAGTAPQDLLMSKGQSEHPTGLASLQGRRLVIVSETGENGRLNEERLKLLTGGDTITARRMRQDFYQFRPTHLLVVQTNHQPRVTGTDEGLWRRLHLVPFKHTVPEGMRDPSLPQKLRKELPGILNWAIAGYQRHRAQGLTQAKIVKQATDKFRGESDTFSQFVAERCQVGRGYSSSSGGLYAAYREWCEANGELARTMKAFSEWLCRKDFEQFRTSKARGWRGIGLTDRNDGDDAL